MHTSRHFNWAIVALLVVGTACDETTAPEANDLSTDELISIALDTDDGADVAIFGELGFLGAAGASAAPALVPETRIHDFSRARPCSDGGQVEVVGTITHTGDRDTQTMEATIEANKFWFDCTRIRNDHTHVLNGSGSVDAYRKRVAGVPVGDQTTRSGRHGQHLEGRRRSAHLRLRSPLGAGSGYDDQPHHGHDLRSRDRYHEGVELGPYWLTVGQTLDGG